MANRKHWAYSAGERGRNRIRAFEKRPGQFFLEFYDEDGRRRRELLRGVNDRDEAKQRADEAAAAAGRLTRVRAAGLTLARLCQLYIAEVSETKSVGKQSHDRRALALWKRFLDAQAEHERRSSRHPSSLDRTDWDRFIRWRGEGMIPGVPRKVRNRQVAYDLKALLAVLYWATGQKQDGRALLETNPWRAEVRKAQRWKMPKELNPHRPAMTDALRQGLVRHAPKGARWHLEAALILGRETRRRNNSIRQLVWSDVDLEAGTVRWRAEADKSGRENVTPLTETAMEVLRRAPSRGIGEVPVFPSIRDPNRPTPRDTWQVWIRRAKANWLSSIEDEQERDELRRRLRGLGYHAEKRAGVRDRKFRSLPPAVQEAWAGTRYETLRTVYDELSVDDMKAAMQAASR